MTLVGIKTQKLLIAVNNNGIRIEPLKSGEKAICQLCNNPVRAYCGEINIYHWRHLEAINCDSWSGDETEWHREWKKQFPFDWQEVVVNKNDELHRADIKTPKGLVVEFQNSSISSSDIRIREKFYGQLLWLINAEKFKENFVIRSEVTSRLKDLKRELYGYNDSYVLDDDEKEPVKKIKKEIKRIKDKKSTLEYIISSEKQLIKNITNLLSEIDLTTKEVLSGTFYLYRIDYKSPNKEQYANIIKKIEAQKELKDKNERKLIRISELEYCKIDAYRNYNYVNPKNVKPSSFHICKAIEISSENSLFPTVVDMEKEIDFKRLSINPNYRLIIDLSQNISELKNTIKAITKQIQQLKESKETIYDLTKTELFDFFNNKRKTVKKEIKIKKKKLISIKKKLINKEVELEQEKELELLYLEKRNNEIERENNREKVRIMKLYKGRYIYRWKYKHRSWDNSEKEIYLDFNTHIFKIISENKLKKLSKKEFINYIINWR